MSLFAEFLANDKPILVSYRGELRMPIFSQRLRLHYVNWGNEEAPPLLMIHGVDDKRITLQQSEDLFENARQPKSMWLVEDASHSEVRDPLLDNQIEDIISFFNNALMSRSGIYSFRLIHS